MVEEEKEIEGKTRSVKRKKEGGRRSKKGGETSLSYLSDEVDGHALAPETTRAPDAVQVVLRLRREVVVDNQGDLLDVDAAREEVGSDQNARRPGAELAHDDVAGVLVHVAVRGRDGVVALAHLVGEPVDLRKVQRFDFGVKNDVSFFPSLSVVVVLSVVVLLLLPLVVLSVVVLLLLLPLVVPLSLLFLSLLSLSFSHLAARVGENDRLGDRERLVEVAEGVKLPLLALLLFWFFFSFFFLS